MEKEEINNIKMLLFNNIARYARSVMNKSLGKFINQNGVYEDIMQSMAEIFFKQLPKYDPYRVKPTTYFSYYFKQVISEYMSTYIYNLSLYYSKNVSKVYASVNKFEEKGIDWTVQMIIEDTKLSEKASRKALNKIFNFHQIDIDQLYNLKSETSTPEEVCVRNETNRLVQQMINDVLTEIECHVLIMRINIDGKRELSYRKLADQLDMPLLEVMKILRTVRTKLQNNRELMYLLEKI